MGLTHISDKMLKDNIGNGCQEKVAESNINNIVAKVNIAKEKGNGILYFKELKQGGAHLQLCNFGATTEDILNRHIQHYHRRTYRTNLTEIYHDKVLKGCTANGQMKTDTTHNKHKNMAIVTEAKESNNEFLILKAQKKIIHVSMTLMKFLISILRAMKKIILKLDSG